MTRLLVIDDDVQLTRELVAALDRHDFTTHYASRAAEGLESLTHELNNALTALRMAVHLLRRRTSGEVVPSGGSATVEELSSRVDQIVARVSRLAVEVQRRAVLAG